MNITGLMVGKIGLVFILTISGWKIVCLGHERTYGIHEFHVIALTQDRGAVIIDRNTINIDRNTERSGRKTNTGSAI